MRKICSNPRGYKFSSGAVPGSDRGPYHYGAHLIYQATEDTNVNAAEAVPHLLMSNLKTKEQIREHAKRMRAGASRLLGLQAAEDAAVHGLKLFSSFKKGAVIAGYWPIGDEIDPRFLMLGLDKAGYKLALPVVTGPETPLTFRLWGQGDPMEKGNFGTVHPAEGAPTVIPDGLIAPLLAFDTDCYRLGWGGGFYDRTLAAHTAIKAFGIAYAAQFMEEIARDSHDWPMQGIITETGVVLPQK